MVSKIAIRQSNFVGCKLCSIWNELMPSTHCLGACILCKRHWLYLVSGASRTSAEAACMACTQGNTQHDVHVKSRPQAPSRPPPIHSPSTCSLGTKLPPRLNSLHMCVIWRTLTREHSAQYIAWAIPCLHVISETRLPPARFSRIHFRWEEGAWGRG